MQVFISPDLLNQARATQKTHGRIVCTRLGARAFLARRLASAARATETVYPELAIEGEEGAEYRLSFVLAEPPGGSDPMLLFPFLPLGIEGMGSEVRPVHQPFLEAILGQEAFLAVGERATQVLVARASTSVGGRVWFRGEVVEDVHSPPSEGVDPRLKGVRVGIVGVGSLGSEVARLLAAGGAEDLVLIDPERLSHSNLRRHYAGPSDVGSLKVDAVKKKLRDEFSVRVHTFDAGVPREDSEDVRAALADCDVLACFADAGAPQHYVNHLAVSLEKPAVIGSILLMPEALGEILVVQKGVPGCLNCWRLELESRKIVMRAETHDLADYPGPAEATPAGVPQYAISQVASTAAALLSLSMADLPARVWLMALEKVVGGFEDLSVLRASLEELQPQSKCLVCGNRRRK